MASNLALNVGNNTFVITGRNSAGRDSKTTVIIYKLPQKKPTVVITAPNKNPFSTLVDKVTVTATILNVSGKSQVAFSTNGRASTSFSFIGTSFTAMNVPLDTGSNTFVITGTNGAGQDTKSTVVIYLSVDPNGNGTGNTNQQGGGINNTGSGAENDGGNNTNKKGGVKPGATKGGATIKGGIKEGTSKVGTKGAPTEEVKPIHKKNG